MSCECGGVILIEADPGGIHSRSLRVSSCWRAWRCVNLVVVVVVVVVVLVVVVVWWWWWRRRFGFKNEKKWL